MAAYSAKTMCALYWSYFFFKLIGLAPFSVSIPRLLRIKKRNSSTKKTFTTSIIGAIHNCALIVSLIYIGSQTFDNAKRDPASPVVKLPKIIGQCLTMIAFSLGIFIWLLFITRQRRLVALANELLELDSIMFRCDSLHLKFPRSTILASVSQLKVSSYLIAAEVSTQHTSVQTLIVFVLPSIIISWTLVQYSLVLHLIEERIANVNQSLLDIGNIPKDPDMPSLYVRKTPVATSASAKIVSIRKVYMDLCNFAYKVRDFYAPPTLMTVAFFGASLVYSCYFLAMPLITGADRHSHLTYINGFAWLSLQLSCFFNLTISVTKITRTVRKTVDVVHLVLDCCSLPADAFRELRGFSCQIFVKKFQLSVYEMFTLDNSLLSSIAGVIITNLIILIQFSISGFLSIRLIATMFVLKLTLLTFRLFGLAPMTISRVQVSDHWSLKTKRSKLRFCWSWLGTAYNIILILGVLGECYHRIPKMLSLGALDNTTFSQMFRNTMIVSANSALITLLLIFCLRQRKLIQLGNDLIKMDNALDQLRGVYQLRSGRVYVVLVMILNLILTILASGMRIAAGQYIAGFVTMILLNCTIFGFYILQYALVVFVIERRFRSLNAALVSLKSKTVRIDDNNRLELVDERTVVVSVIVIKRSYGRLYELCSEVSNFYAPLMIFIVIYSSTTFLYTFYVIFIRFVVGPSAGSLRSLQTISELMWIFVRSLPLVLLTANVRKTHIQMQLTADITYDLQARFAAYREIKTELKNFILDLMHRNFQFTVYGVFLIDCSLLKSMVSTITTYLVIFVQFQSAANKDELHGKK